jgi:hypothetical protein
LIFLPCYIDPPHFRHVGCTSSGVHVLLNLLHLKQMQLLMYFATLISIAAKSIFVVSGLLLMVSTRDSRDCNCSCYH